MDGNSKFIGTITDGDIRRSLLKSNDLNLPISFVANKKSFTISPTSSQEEVRQIMRVKGAQQVPVVDAQGIVSGLYSWMPEDLKLRPNQMVIMAGGKGSRLLPLTADCPKPMLKISGKPMLEHIIERAIEDGFNKFIISINYLGEQIKQHFGDGKKIGVEVTYLEESLPMGTAGALSLLDVIPMEPLVITNGDVLTEISYGSLLDFHIDHSAHATMAIRPHILKNPYGVVRLNGININGFDEKPITKSYINAGVYAINPDVLKLMKKNEPLDMPMLFDNLSRKGKQCIAYPMHEHWIDIGAPHDYQEALNLFLGRG